MRRACSLLLSSVVAFVAVASTAGTAVAIEPPTVRITPGVTSVVVGDTVQLTATVRNLDNTEVTWSVRRGPGSVDGTGLYTPPAIAPASPWAVVRATSVEDAGLYGEATVAIASGVAAGGLAPKTPLAGGSLDAQVGDVNGDGRADLVRLQHTGGSLQIARVQALLSDGAGGFTEKNSGYLYFGQNNSDYYGDLVLGDFDADGDLDGYAAVEAMTSAFAEYVMFTNDGTGQFTAGPVTMAEYGEGRAGAIALGADVDGDTRTDIVRLDRFGTVTVHRALGTGSFALAVSWGSTFGGKTLSVGDLTGDGRPEIVVGTRTAGGTSEMKVFDVYRNDGFGAVGGKATYTTGIDPEPVVYDADGDGWNDVVVGYGGVHYTFHPPRLHVFRNAATGTGALTTPSVQLLAFRPYELEAAHVDGDGVLDLVGTTHAGPVLLKRTGPNTFAEVHSVSPWATNLAVGDVTGDGRADVYAGYDTASLLHPGSADTTFAFAVDPTVTYLNATHTADLTATITNAPAVPDVTWSATRGSFPDRFSPAHYVAPSTASPAGSPARLTATLTGTAHTATRDITIVNDQYTFTALGSQNVRQLATDPAAPNTVYAATAAGVYRSTSGGATFSPLGATTSTGTDAREVTVARDGDTVHVVARFATGLWRWDGATWLDSDGGSFTPAAVEALPGTPTVYAAATTGSVWRSADGGATWSDAGGTSVTDVVPVDAGTFWAVRSAAPRVSLGTVTGGTAAYAAKETPQPAAAVQALAVDPDDRTTAFVAISEANGRRLFRGDTSGAWTASPVPAVVNRLAVAPDGTVVALDDDSANVFKSLDGGTSWFSIHRGFTANPLTAAFRTDSLTLVGTTSGLYTPLDLTPPEAPTVTSGPAGTTGPGTTGSFAFSFTGTAASFRCALDGAGWAACTSGKTYNGPLASGSHTFSVVAVDENGNESAPATHTWSVDATPPDVPVITAGPSGTVKGGTATFEFTLPADAAGAVCALDGATPAACTSPHAYTGLTETQHTFAVRSVDEYGNRSPAATRTWTPDVTPPQRPQLYMRPGYYSADTESSFGWYSDPSATYTCVLDGVPGTCDSKSSHALTGLTEGYHTFEVYAADAVGNTSGDYHTWYVDLTPPETPVFTAVPDAETFATAATFEFSTPSQDGLAGYYCSLDGGPVAHCWAYQEYSGLAGGPHTFEVYAYDYAGRTSPVATHVWRVLVETPPGAPVIQTGPSGHVASTTAAFTYTVAEGLTARCSLDGGTPTSCATTGTTYTGLAEGPHTFSVYAVSGTGTLSEPATASWTVDVTPPAKPVLSAKPPLRTGSTSASFGWTADGALTYACSLDAVTVACGTGSYAASGLGHGSHTFALVARDAAGNESAAATHTWTVDLLGPAVSLDAKPAPVVRATTLSFAVSSTAEDLAAFHCTFDGEPVDCADGTADVEVPADSSPYTFQVYATDDLGNAGATVTYDVFVDYGTPSGVIHTRSTSLTAPRIVSWDEIVTNVTTQTVRIVVTGTTTPVPATLACRDHANVVVACTGDTVREAVLTPAKPLVPGQRYTVQASGVTDTVGNVMEAESFAFRASTVEQEGTAGATASWRKVALSSALGGSYVVTDVKGATATYEFTGSRLVWYGRRGPQYGTAYVYVDGKAKGTVNFYSSSAGSTYKVFDGLGSGRHTVKIVVRGAKGSTRGTGTFVAVDAFKVGSTTAATPAARYAWAVRSATAASGGRYAIEDNAGATIVVRFRGTAFSWVTALGPNMGKATVKIDGKPAVTVDNYASSARFGYVRKFGGLTDAVHTVTIRVLGQRRSGATGTAVVFDRFGIT